RVPNKTCLSYQSETIFLNKALHRSLNPHLPAREWIAITQFDRSQSQVSRSILVLAIEFIADNRMAAMREMQSDLMRPPGQWSGFDQRGLFHRLHHSKVGFGLFAGTWVDFHQSMALRVRSEFCVARPLTLSRHPMHYG